MANVGQTATFTVVATGTPTPTYQWQRQASGTTGFVALANGGSYSGVATATLTVSGVTLAMSGDQFRCVVANGVSPDATSDAASLTVPPPIVFTSAASTTFTVGQAGSFTVTASGTPAPMFVATGLPAWATFNATTGVLGGTPPSTAGAPFTVTLMAVNGAAPMATQSFTLNVQQPTSTLVITTQPQGQIVNAGQTVTLSVVATGTPPPTSYQWRKGATNLTDGGSISGATTFTLTIANAQPADTGAYSVLVGNGLASVPSDTAAVTVIPAGTSATHAVLGNGYVAGGTVTITNTLAYTGALTGLDWQVLLPTGWTFAADNAPAGATRSTATPGLLEWTWTTIPPSLVKFTYTLNVPAGTTGNRELVAKLVLQTGGLTIPFTAKPDPLIVGPATYHAADTDHNWRLSLLELTRVIELYNTRNGTVRTGCYAVQAGSEDGFTQDAARANTAAVTLTCYHSADTDHNGRLSLLELTRVIELYNYRVGTSRTGQYHVSSTPSEDGFAPGPNP
jgi:hypothetical protein